jgi:predicted phage terminase large subunit-like protein
VKRGNIIDPAWFGSFDPTAISRRPGLVVQSWDTASKDNPYNDWSVCVSALVRSKDIFILDVLRRRMQIPQLRDTAVRLAREHRADVVLVEDHASGTQLIQLLRTDRPAGVPGPIARRAETDKQSRALLAAATIEAGNVYLPHDAPWLPEFVSELAGFPNSRFDDQVDALSQLVNWAYQHEMVRPLPNAGPIEMDDQLLPDWTKGTPEVSSLDPWGAW